MVIDLSAVHQNPEAASVAMIAANGWVQALLAMLESEHVPRRILVLEEIWAFSVVTLFSAPPLTMWTTARLAMAMANVSMVAESTWVGFNSDSAKLVFAARDQ